MNNLGQVVGDNDLAPFLWEDRGNGVMIDLGPLPGGCCAQAVAVNEEGQVVGSGRNASGHNHAALWEFTPAGGGPPPGGGPPNP